MRTYSDAEYKQISNKMTESDNSFIVGLGRIMRYADREDKRKLSEAFPNRFKKYLYKL